MSTVYDVERDATATTVDPSLVRAALVVGGAFALLGVLLIGAMLWSLFTGGVSRSWTDEHGRVCTTTAQGLSVSTDCDYPPAEDRIGSFFRDLYGEGQ